MAVPVISNLPPAPTRSDGPADFTPKADAMIGALQPMVVQTNAVTSFINTTANQVAVDALFAGQAADRAEAVDTTLGQYVDAAAQSAIDATNNGAAQVALAAAEVTKANAQANNAAASALAAESAPGSIGNIAFLHAVALSF